jgi:hypothetical protein
LIDSNRHDQAPTKHRDGPLDEGKVSGSKGGVNRRVRLLTIPALVVVSNTDP